MKRIKIKGVIEYVRNLAETIYIESQVKRLTFLSEKSDSTNSIKNVEKLEKIWSKKTHSMFRYDSCTDKRFYTFEDWIAEIINTTWHVKKWDNVSVDCSNNHFDEFKDTILQKGKSSGLYSIIKSEDNKFLCSKKPYRIYNKLIYIPVNQDTLKSLYKNKITEFQSVFRYF